MRVVVVARDERFRLRARGALASMPSIALSGEALDPPSAAVVCALCRPDIVVMDALLTWAEASAIVRRIQETEPGTRIIACTLTHSRRVRVPR